MPAWAQGGSKRGSFGIPGLTAGTGLQEGPGVCLCPLAGVQPHGTELHPFGISAPGLAFLLIAAELLEQSHSPPPTPNHTKTAGKDLGW